MIDIVKPFKKFHFKLDNNYNISFFLPQYLSIDEFK